MRSPASVCPRPRAGDCPWALGSASFLLTGRPPRHCFSHFAPKVLPEAEEGGPSALTEGTIPGSSPKSRPFNDAVSYL